jgi:hypothetical protein
MAVAGSFRSSFNDDHHHTVDDATAASEISSSGEEDATAASEISSSGEEDATAASEISSSGEEDAARDEDEDVFLVARPREVVPTTMDLISSRERERERELNVIVCLGVSNSRVFFFLYICFLSMRRKPWHAQESG